MEITAVRSGLWHYCESGTGRPLVLLHGIGMSHFVWSAVIPYLCPTRRVLAFDMAGFGFTPPLPEGTVPTVPHLVDDLEKSLDRIGIELPVDIAGNSLGGYMALEAARRGIARTVVAICPAGLWKEHPAPHVRYVFGAARFLATRFPGFLKAVVRFPVLREAVFAAPISVGSRRMPVTMRFAWWTTWRDRWRSKIRWTQVGLLFLGWMLPFP